jgi:hypothetical protein
VGLRGLLVLFPALGAVWSFLGGRLGLGGRRWLGAGCRSFANEVVDELSGEMPMPQWRVGARREAPVGALKS